MKSERVSQYFDEDLRDIERGRPDGLLDSYSGIFSIILMTGFAIVELARHFGH
ncbi:MULTISPECIES: hypothetical protein [Burkholderia]|uniref:hypothetical protein n=1 Tax=Burkholderia TaxID=32008 RepID=UPI0012EBF40B|nr:MULTISPECIES: hypothetical protein [Burkholderia]